MILKEFLKFIHEYESIMVNVMSDNGYDDCLDAFMDFEFNLRFSENRKREPYGMSFDGRENLTPREELILDILMKCEVHKIYTDYKLDKEYDSYESIGDYDIDGMLCINLKPIRLKDFLSKVPKNIEVKITDYCTDEYVEPIKVLDKQVRTFEVKTDFNRVNGELYSTDYIEVVVIWF